jgi:hypothetical protein
MCIEPVEVQEKKCYETWPRESAEEEEEAYATPAPLLRPIMLRPGTIIPPGISYA